MNGPIDAVKLTEALQLLAERHHLLRAKFGIDDSVQEQEYHRRIAEFGRTGRVSPATYSYTVMASTLARISLSKESLVGINPREQDLVIDNFLSTARITPFEYASPPLMRALLIEASTDKHYLLLSVPHLICDLVSVDIIRRDLARLYQLLGGSVLPSFPELTRQFADFSTEQHRMLLDTISLPGTRYWAQIWNTHGQSRLTLEQMTSWGYSLGPTVC